jgi:hypothetical protein
MAADDIPLAQRQRTLAITSVRCSTQSARLWRRRVLALVAHDLSVLGSGLYALDKQVWRHRSCIAIAAPQARA